MALFLDVDDKQKRELLSALGLLHALKQGGEEVTLEHWIQCARVHCLSKVRISCVCDQPNNARMQRLPPPPPPLPCRRRCRALSADPCSDSSSPTLLPVCALQIESYFLQDASQLRQPLNLRNEAAAVSLLLAHWSARQAGGERWFGQPV